MAEDKMNPRVLIVGAKPELVSSLRHQLSDRACEVHVASDGFEGRLLIGGYAPSVVLLETRLPDESSYEFVRDIRQTSSLPIIMLADSGSEDRVVALEMGADDCISKPFSPTELWARIRAILRRTRNPDRAAQVQSRDRQTACFCGWRMELGSRRLMSPDGNYVHLTAAEFSLLTALVKCPLRIHTRKQLHTAAAGPASTAGDRAVDIHITRIRSKLEVDPRKPVLITTEHGVGYMFSQAVEWGR